MKRLKKILLIAAVVLAVVLATGSWALNRWLQSPEAHARIEHEIGNAIRMPLKIGKLNFSAWSGLTAQGITVTAGDGNFLEAESLSVEHKFSSLFRGRIVLGEVRIVQPRVRLVESPDGRWRIPQLPAATAAAPPDAVPSATHSPTATDVAKSLTPKKQINVLVGSIVIADASAELIDKQRLPFATVKGLNATFHDVSETASSGDFSIGSVTVQGYGTAGQIQGKAEHHDMTFSVRDLSANVLKGRVVGEASYTLGSPASARLTIENVDISLVGSAARARMRNASGIVSGGAELAGFDTGTKAMTGEGTFVLRSGRCTEIELVRQIGEVLQYAALAGFEVREARAKFRIA